MKKAFPKLIVDFKENGYYCRLWLLSILFLLVVVPVFTQPTKIAFQKYGVAEGLPEEFVSRVVQDDQGFIWFTTQSGLVKYDGYQFFTYSYEPDDTNTFSLKIRNLNGGIIKAKDGRLWIGGVLDDEFAVAMFDPITEKFDNYQINPNDPKGIPYQHTLLLYEDSSGNIWLHNSTDRQDTAILCRINPHSGMIQTYPFQFKTFNNPIRQSGKFVEIYADSSILIIDDQRNLISIDQKTYDFKEVISFGKKLPGTEITDSLQSICQGKKNVYIVAKRGVYQFDPLSNKITKIYRNKKGDSNSLDPEEIRYAFEDTYGRLWVCHSNAKFSIINKDGSRITRLKNGDGTFNFDSKVSNMEITIQNEDGIWFQLWSLRKPTTFLYYSHESDEFTSYDSKFNHDLNEISLTTYSLYYRMFFDRTGLMWLYTRPNLYKESPKSLQMDLFRNKAGDAMRLPSDTIFELLEDHKKRLWIGTPKGLGVYSKKTDDITIFRHDLLGPNSISNNWIQIVFEDSEGKIWIGTRNGLNIFDETTQSFKRLYYKPTDLEIEYDRAWYDFYSGLMEDHLGRIWATPWDKGTLLLNKKDGSIIKQYLLSDKDKHGLTSARITRYFQDSRKNIWLGDPQETDQGLFRYDSSNDHFKHFFHDSKDSTSITSNEIGSIQEDIKNRLWIATDEGLNQFHFKSDSFLRYPYKYFPSMVNFITDKKGIVWVATYTGKGLVSLDPETGNISLYGEKEGLLHNDGAVLNPLTIDHEGNIWLPNQRGLSVFNINDKRYKNYTTADGFQPYTRFYKTIQTSDGNIWIGGRHGLNRINPEILNKKDSIPPEVLITSMNIMGTQYDKPDGEIFQKAVSYTDKIQLNHEQKDISFEFVGLHFLRPKDNLYSWKLENYDKEWTEPSTKRTAIYTNLLPGKYFFRVRASNADQVWNMEGAAMTIIIAPPWWQTIWAYILYGLIFLAGVFVVDRYQRKRLADKQLIKVRDRELKQAKEIEKAYHDLKTTQGQLIHAEKMASLGELTAGIAHEIQNPLNFVNNFSEVNTELIEELKEEIKNKNLDEAEDIVDNISTNEEKINFHGKRADSIVKGMLLHSRSTSTNKELTDINNLADEYLRLAYHGLRAKNKSFNADFKTEFDNTLPKINVIPQDIGRVFLNLINNAFHAVTEKSAKGDQGYSPIVLVSTKQKNNLIEIKIKDNGNGIPPDVLNKIFQPFFTTKPTGEGTGLGLSISFDIITKGHQGELKVDTVVGEFTEFTILLPKLS